MIKLELDKREAAMIRQLLGQAPHDAVNGLIVRLETLMREDAQAQEVAHVN